MYDEMPDYVLVIWGGWGVKLKGLISKAEVLKNPQVFKKWWYVHVLRKDLNQKAEKGDMFQLFRCDHG